ncbi:hypothetical protein [Blattabacterium cuenoti]|uniref:hypothetical protein n=1 Tax=Blattabacterium cuenoti TaxID=1653831 RepID=UPI00163CA29A|nr:hypothetical protein [Blattabacterium cuenoti]
MGYKYILFIFSFVLSSCNSPLFPLLYKRKTIEIGNFINTMCLPKICISSDFRKNFEEYIERHSPLQIVSQNGEIFIEGAFLDYVLMSQVNSPIKKIKLIMKIYYKDKMHPQNNSVKYLSSTEYFSYKKDPFLRKSVNKIMRNLTVKIFNIISDINQ